MFFTLSFFLFTRIMSQLKFRNKNQLILSNVPETLAVNPEKRHAKRVRFLLGEEFIFKSLN